MSLLNALATWDELLIEVDSLGGLPPGLQAPESQRSSAFVKVPKVAIIAHQGLVAATRGAQLFNLLLSQGLQVMPFNCADELMDHLADLLAEADRKFRELAASQAPALLETENDGIVGIHSPRLQRIRAVRFQIDVAGAVTIEEMAQDGSRDVHMTPWFDELDDLETAALRGQGGIEAAPALQLRLVQERRPEFMTGGDIVTVRLKKGAISVSRRPEPDWRSVDIQARAVNSNPAIASIASTLTRLPFSASDSASPTAVTAGRAGAPR